MRYPSEFLEWWEHWPKKVQKEKALKAWKAACRKVGPERLLAAVQQYAQSQQAQGDHQFIPYPASWLNAGAYDDDPREWNVAAAKPQRTKTDQDALEQLRKEGLIE